MWPSCFLSGFGMVKVNKHESQIFVGLSRLITDMLLPRSTRPSYHSISLKSIFFPLFLSIWKAQLMGTLHLIVSILVCVLFARQREMHNVWVWRTHSVRSVSESFAGFLWHFLCPALSVNKCWSNRPLFVAVTRHTTKSLEPDKELSVWEWCWADPARLLRGILIQARDTHDLSFDTHGLNADTH